MFKKVMITLSICIAMSLLIVGFIIYKDLQVDSESAEEQPEKTTETSNETETVPAVAQEKDNEETEDLNPFGDNVQPEDMTVIDTEDYIHEMSHQKVVADVKWGFYEITDDRIDWLLEVVQQKDFPNKKVYEGILTRWKKDDFSNIVEDHNSIWRLQGGTIGKATGVLSEEEEQAYISNNKEN